MTKLRNKKRGYAVVQSVLIALLIVVQFAPVAVFAEEDGGEAPAQEVVTEVVQVEPEPQPEPEPTEEQTVIETGDAVAETVVDNNVNDNEVVIENEGSTEEGGNEEGENPEEQNETEETKEQKVELIEVVENNEEDEDYEDTPTTTEEVLVDVENDADVDNETDTDANTGENEASGNSSDTTIDTGDALSGTGVHTLGNTTEVDTGDPCDACIVDDSFDTENSTDKLLKSTDIEVENDADVDTETDSKGNSGRNKVADNTANVYIKTGDVAVFTDIMNFINTTLIGDGKFDVINIYDLAGGFNYLDFSGFGVIEEDEDEAYDESTENSTTTSAHNSTTVEIDNEAEVVNDVDIDATSGDNLIVGVDGNVIIETGDVVADTSIFNGINTSIVGRGWQFMVINIYSDVAGDIVLPTLYGQEKTITGCSGCLDFLKVTTDNIAEVQNTVETVAETGNNIVEDVEGKVEILTGNAYGRSSIFNLVNKNIIGNDWYTTTFNIGGWWSGKVHNAPKGRTHFEHGGSTITIDPPGQAKKNNKDEETSETTNSLEVDVENEALVTNDVDVDGSSGNNTVKEVTGDVLIDTGDVYANTSLTNLVNTTIVGDDWKFFLINVFGNWEGDLHYGMPDLAVAEIAEPNSYPLRRDGRIEYFIAYTNGGDAPADDVVLSDTFDPDVVSIYDANGGDVDTESGVISWDLGTVNPGESRIQSYRVRVHTDVDTKVVMNTAFVFGNNGDRSDENNITGGALEIASFVDRSAFGNGWVPDPYLTLDKSADYDLVEAGETVNYMIRLENTSAVDAYEVYVEDILQDESDTNLVFNDWEIGQMFAGEVIELTYSLQVPGNIEPGVYTNTAKAFFRNENGVEMAWVGDDHDLIVVHNPNAPLSEDDTFEAFGLVDDLNSENQGTAIETESNTLSEADGEEAAGTTGESQKTASINANGNRGSESVIVQGFEADDKHDEVVIAGSIASEGPVGPAAKQTGSSEADSSSSSMIFYSVVTLSVLILFAIIRKLFQPLSRDKLKI